jgi:hypothetical protein
MRHELKGMAREGEVLVVVGKRETTLGYVESLRDYGESWPLLIERMD